MNHTVQYKGYPHHHLPSYSNKPDEPPQSGERNWKRGRNFNIARLFSS